MGCCKHIRNLFLAVSVLFCISFSAMKSADTVVVQTFTFDSLSARRATFNFPDNNDTYRKIWMYYTLKCDPRSVWDKYNCGEWDYLTYTIVYKPTGTKDSSQNSYFHYKIGNMNPDTIFSCTNPTYNTYKKYLYNRVIDKVNSEAPFKYEPTKYPIQMENAAGHMQMLYTSDELMALGMTSGNIGKFGINIRAGLCTIRNLKIKLKTLSAVTETGLDLTNLKTYYQNDYVITSTGWNDVILTQPFAWKTGQSILVDISFDGFDGADAITFEGNMNKTGYGCIGTDGTLSLTNNRAWIDCSNLPELKSAEHFTVETWIKIKNWKSNAQIFNQNGIIITCGDAAGTVNCFVRNPDNTRIQSLTALPANKWTHLALVYDASQSDNAKRLKLYSNGKLAPITKYYGTIPYKTANADDSFIIGSNSDYGDPLDANINNFRVWKSTNDSATIADWYTKTSLEQHPNYSDLLFNYTFDNYDAKTALDNSPNAKNGTLYGLPTYENISSDSLTLDGGLAQASPNISLTIGDYTSHLDSTLVTNIKFTPKSTLQEYTLVDHKPVIKNMTYINQPGYCFIYDASGKKVDSTYIAADDQILNSRINYYSAPFDKLEENEIARYITPYGIGLDLGPDGFTWRFDVTDYADLLKGKVDLSAANTQEVLDLKFVFIKGTPPRKVLDIQKIWGPYSYITYGDLSTDKALSNKTLNLNPDAKQFKVITRLSGHGEQKVLVKRNIAANGKTILIILL